MKVNLIATTFPLIKGINTAEELITYCARVSNPSNQLNIETAPKLLKYCINHGHWSVFEQVDLTFEIVTSRDISAQILRHKSFSFQEFSQRYSEVTKLEPFQLRKQAEKNRQSSAEDYILSEEEQAKISEFLNNSLDLYKYFLNKGVAKESIRKILPMCTETTLYMKGNARSWIHYIDLRTKIDTQKEHRDIALAIKDLFVQQFPNIAQALEWH